MWIFQQVQKTIERKSVGFSSPKTIHISEKIPSSQNHIQSAFTKSGIELNQIEIKKLTLIKTKFEDLQNQFILALNARLELPRTRILSKIWFLCKITSTKKWFFRTIRLNIWCKRLGNLRNRIWKQPPSSSREIESTFWKDRTLFYNIFALPSQNHIKHDTLYTLDWIFLIKGLFEPKYHTWIQLKVRAKPRTTFFSERSPIRQIHIKDVAITFPTSFHNLR